MKEADDNAGRGPPPDHMVDSLALTLIEWSDRAAAGEPGLIYDVPPWEAWAGVDLASGPDRTVLVLRDEDQFERIVGRPAPPCGLVVIDGVEYRVLAAMSRSLERSERCPQDDRPWVAMKQAPKRYRR